MKLVLVPLLDVLRRLRFLKSCSINGLSELIERRTEVDAIFVSLLILTINAG